MGWQWWLQPAFSRPTRLEYDWSSSGGYNSSLVILFDKSNLSLLISCVYGHDWGSSGGYNSSLVILFDKINLSLLISCVYGHDWSSSGGYNPF